MVDLMNLEGVLKTGAIHNDGGKRMDIIFPVCRISFPKIVKPEQYKGQGEPRFTVTQIFNTGNPLSPAFVDLNTVVAPAMASVARANGMNIAGSGVNPFEKGIKYNKEGTPYDGYEEWTHWISAAKYPKNENSVVQCYSATATTAIDPKEVYGGCYGRLMVQIYKPKKWDTLGIGIGWVQFVAHGDAFGDGEKEYEAPSAIPGAVDVSEPKVTESGFVKF